MRWHRLGLLLALTGCAGGPQCTLIGCVSQLTVHLPTGTSAGTACVAGVCTSAVVDGQLRVPLSRGAEGDTAAVTVTLPGQPAYEGEVPLLRTRPNGPDCPPVCVNGSAELDLDRGRVVGGPPPPRAACRRRRRTCTSSERSGNVRVIPAEPAVPSVGSRPRPPRRTS